MKKKPAIDEQDVALFREAASGTRLIRQDTISPVRQPVKQKARLREMRVTIGTSHYFSDEFVPLLNSEGPTRYVREDVSSFEAKRLRRGDYVPDMLLDLHGHIAFANARTNPERFKAELCAEIRKQLDM